MKLTDAQERAAARLTDRWQSAYTLQAPITTLDALVKRGVAQRRRNDLGSFYSPRTSTFYRRAPGA